MESIRDLVCSSRLYEKPVEEANEKIDDTKSRVVVIGGGRGTGKSTILVNRTVTNNMKGVSSVYAKLSPDDKDMYVSEELKEHYYELFMSGILLDHISKNGKPSKLSKIIDGIRTSSMKKLIKKINNDEEIDLDDEKIMHYGDFTYELVDEIRRGEGTDKVELIIDRFDWTDNSSKETQQNIKYYFQLFDKVILTTDDPNYHSNYPLIELDYIKDLSIVNQILSLYIAESNIKDKQSWLDFFNSQTIYDLMTIADGNLKTLMEAFIYISSYASLTEINKRAVIEKFKEFILAKKARTQKVKSLYNDIKFHI